MKEYPKTAHKLLHLHEGWIVGNHSKTARDLDILISFLHWREAAALIPSTAKPNTFGGWKFLEDGIWIDVWPGDLAWLMTNTKFKSAFHPRTGTKITKS